MFFADPFEILAPPVLADMQSAPCGRDQPLSVSTKTIQSPDMIGPVKVLSGGFFFMVFFRGGDGAAKATSYLACLRRLIRLIFAGWYRMT